MKTDKLKSSVQAMTLSSFIALSLSACNSDPVLNPGFDQVTSFEFNTNAIQATPHLTAKDLPEFVVDGDQHALTMNGGKTSVSWTFKELSDLKGQLTFKKQDHTTGTVLTETIIIEPNGYIVTQEQLVDHNQSSDDVRISGVY